MVNRIVNFRVEEWAAGETRVTPELGDRGALQSSGDAFHALADTMPQMVWSTLPNGDHDYYNARWYEFTGAPVGSTDGEGWADMFHAEDQPEAWNRWRHSLQTGAPYEVEYRLRHHSGEYRWVLGRALPIVGADNSIQRWIGTCTDIDEAKQTASRNAILSRELSHRIKNIFAIISSLISLTARSNESFRDTAKELGGRIAALGRAHEFVRPHDESTEADLGDVTLQNLLQQIFMSYPAFTDRRMKITGVDLSVSDRAATPVALIFHELATNSMKYGALHSDAGRVDLAIGAAGDTVTFLWEESGGPAIDGPPARSGFGTQLIDMAIKHQLGGALERHWTRNGLTLSFEVRKSRLDQV